MGGIKLPPRTYLDSLESVNELIFAPCCNDCAGEMVMGVVDSFCFACGQPLCGACHRASAHNYGDAFCSACERGIENDRDFREYLESYINSSR